MKQKRIAFYLGKKRYNLLLTKENSFGEAIGLRFKKRENAKALLFEPLEEFTLDSYFVFFPFIVLWLNKDNKVVDIRRIKPFTFHIQTKKHFKRIIEIPINKKYEKIVRLLQA